MADDNSILGNDQTLNLDQEYITIKGVQ